MSPQKEHFNRISVSTLSVQSLDIDLELLPVVRARIDQTESIWQLGIFSLWRTLGNERALLTAPMTLGSALGSSWTKKPGM